MLLVVQIYTADHLKNTNTTVKYDCDTIIVWEDVSSTERGEWETNRAEYRIIIYSEVLLVGLSL